MQSASLKLWNDSAAKLSIINFVGRVTKDGSPDFVPPAGRVAVFDNDGTLWCEKPMPIEADFILRRLAEMASTNPPLRQRQPFKAAYEMDYKWLGDAITKHYQGDDAELKIILEGVQEAYGGMIVQQYEAQAGAFLEAGHHPTLGRPYLSCAYSPMRELLDYLTANGFTNYIASGGDRDFMRAMANRLYAVPRERIVGSTLGLKYENGNVVYKPTFAVFDDGPEKPIGIWTLVGRRPILAAGNSNGDIEMLEYTAGSGRQALRLLVHHDDAKREFAYDAGAEHALDLAHSEGWGVISMREDWNEVFPDLEADRQRPA